MKNKIYSLLALASDLDDLDETIDITKEGFPYDEKSPYQGQDDELDDDDFDDFDDDDFPEDEDL